MGPDNYGDWVEVTIPELKAYFGFCILMGLVKLPALEDYWKVDPFLHFPPIAGQITRQRFRDISRYLHFSDNTTLALRGQPSLVRSGLLSTTAVSCLGIATIPAVSVQLTRP